MTLIEMRSMKAVGKKAALFAPNTLIGGSMCGNEKGLEMYDKASLAWHKGKKLDSLGKGAFSAQVHNTAILRNSVHPLLEASASGAHTVYCGANASRVD